MSALLAGGAASNEVVETTFMGTVEWPPCTLTGPTSVELDPLLLGQSIEHSSFDLAIECPIVARHVGLYAEARGQTMLSASRVAMTHARGATGTPAKLHIVTSHGMDIPLGSEGATDPARQFCRGSGTLRTCTLTPWTQTSGNTPLGAVTAAITFTLVLP
ncbi:MAG: hypothetical protein ACRCYK_13795 [Aeromonas hydrophila]